MEESRDARRLDSVRHAAVTLQNTENDYDGLMRDIGDSPIVLIGEASHGTHEFYRERARITQRLILEKGFNAIALEADWPDMYRVNRYVRLLAPEDSATEALADFRRFPTWMWRNLEMVDFVDWLHRWNQGLPIEQTVGVYGLDLYSLHTSVEAVIHYLETVDPKAAAAARRRYSCFENYEQDMQDYGFMTAYGLSRSCENEVVSQLMELRQQAWNYANRNNPLAAEEFFNAEMNARLAKSAERYYRSMFKEAALSWNVRDIHMADTLDALLTYLGQRFRQPKVVVWAHNSHLGDARATYMAGVGKINIGQLIREKYGDEVYNIGFTTHTGMVTATSEWNMPAGKKKVRSSLPGSWENLFHRAETPAFLLNLRNPDLRSDLDGVLLERAIGVIYLPRSERQSHYFNARLIDQFDTVIHLDRTQAVEPIEPNPEWIEGELPETFPSAL